MRVKEDLVAVIQDALGDLATVVTSNDNGTPHALSIATNDGHTYRAKTLWAGEGWPSDVRSVLSSRPDGAWPRDVVVVARSLSPGAIELLEDLNANWVDWAGNIRIVMPPGLLIHRDAPPDSEVAPRPFSWSRSAVQIAEFVLSERAEQPLRTGEIAQATKSPGMVSRVLQSFDSLGWTEAQGAKAGAGAWRSLVNPGAMLDSWADHVGSQKRRKRRAHHTTRSLLRFTEAQLAEVLGPAQDEAWALTTWGGLELVAPFTTSIPAIHIYVPASRFRSEVDSIMREAGLREVDEGARFEFWEADFPLRTQHDDWRRTPVVATPRLYADLLALGSRGADAAQHLRETKLGF